MNKNDLTKIVSQKTMTFKDARELVDLMFESIENALKSGDKVMITGFGTFVLKKRKAKLGRNPKTGKEVMIEEREKLRFKPSKHF